MNDQGPNWGPNRAPSDSYSDTTEELLVNRLGDTVLINHSVNQQTDQFIMKATEFSWDFTISY